MGLYEQLINLAEEVEAEQFKQLVSQYYQAAAGQANKQQALDRLLQGLKDCRESTLLLTATIKRPATQTKLRGER